MSGAAIGDVVVIPADEPSWTDTGFDIRGLTGFGFSATGLACYDTADDCQNGEAWTGPDGTEEIADEAFAAPGLKKHALVGKIGDGDPFLIGSSAYVDCGPSGVLFLIYNDSEFSDNSGSYELNIQQYACDNLCMGSTSASTYPQSPLYGSSDLAKHLACFLLPLGAMITLRFLRRKL
jgi:hypothetical protein